MKLILKFLVLALIMPAVVICNDNNDILKQAIIDGNVKKVENIIRLNQLDKSKLDQYLKTAQEIVSNKQKVFNKNKLSKKSWAGRLITGSVLIGASILWLPSVAYDIINIDDTDSIFYKIKDKKGQLAIQIPLFLGLGALATYTGGKKIAKPVYKLWKSDKDLSKAKLIHYMLFSIK